MTDAEAYGEYGEMVVARVCAKKQPHLKLAQKKQIEPGPITRMAC